MDFENILLDSDIQGYFYEPQYSQEESKRMEEEAAAAAAEQALPVAEDEEPQRAGGVPVCSVRLWTHRVPVRQRISAMPVSSKRNG